MLAEGIESKKEYEFLRDNGIDLVQGFLSWTTGIR
ncbi:MAG: hypothetical protein ACLR7D_10135 [Lachnospira eligens]